MKKIYVPYKASEETALAEAEIRAHAGQEIVKTEQDDRYRFGGEPLYWATFPDGARHPLFADEIVEVED